MDVILSHMWFIDNVFCIFENILKGNTKEGFVPETVQIVVKSWKWFQAAHVMQAQEAFAHYHHINGMSFSSFSEDET